MSVAIIDYGLGNLPSVQRALEECGADVFIAESPERLAEATHLILPGVGAFPDGMANLHDQGWVSAIAQAVHQEKKPLLGICLGMQLLMSSGDEVRETPGLGLIPGVVTRLEAKAAGERIPHVGWNEVHPVRDSGLFCQIPAGSDYYFVHSFHAVPENPAHILSTTPYAGGFVSAVINANVLGVQFHPEKSAKYGFQLLKNFLAMAAESRPC